MLRRIHPRAPYALARNVIAFHLLAGLALLALACLGCGTTSHNEEQSDSKPQKTTDDGPAVERVAPTCAG